MALHPMLTMYLDGLDASTDGRGFDANHEEARKYVEGALALVAMLTRMTTPTDDATSQDDADDIMADLDDETLCSDATTLYDLIRQAKALSA